MSIGAMLKERREELGMELPDIAAYLRIRLPYLEAIEAEDYAKLPGSAFTIGFIRSYAHHLGFDSDKVLTQFRKDSAEAAERPALVMRVPIATSRAPTGKIVAAALVIILLIWGAWLLFSQRDHKVSEVVPAVPERLKPEAAPVPSAPSGEAPEGEADEAVNDTGQKGGPFAIQAPPPQAQASAPASGVNYGVPGAPAGHVEIRAIDNAWVEVADDTGASIFTGVLHPGDKFPVPSVPNNGKAYTLTTGNGGGIELALDGVAGQPLGETGRIIRGIPLDPAHVASKKTP